MTYICPGILPCTEKLESLLSDGDSRKVCVLILPAPIRDPQRNLLEARTPSILKYIIGIFSPFWVSYDLTEDVQLSAFVDDLQSRLLIGCLNRCFVSDDVLIHILGQVHQTVDHIARIDLVSVSVHSEDVEKVGPAYSISQILKLHDLLHASLKIQRPETTSEWITAFSYMAEAAHGDLHHNFGGDRSMATDICQLISNSSFLNRPDTFPPRLVEEYEEQRTCTNVFIMGTGQSPTQCLIARKAKYMIDVPFVDLGVSRPQPDYDSFCELIDGSRLSDLVIALL